MKKHYLLAIGLWMSLFANASTIDLNGTAYPVDTTSHYQVGPGTWYSRFTITIGNNKHNCYLLEVDLNNPYNRIEEYQSQGKMGSTETLASAYTKLDAPEHHTIGGVNANFWVVNAQNIGEYEGCIGQPFAGTARNGVLVGEPDGWNAGHGDRGYVMVDNQKQVYIENVNYLGWIRHGEALYNIRDVNRNRVNAEPNEIALFNQYAKPTRTRNDITEVVFETNGWTINNIFSATVKSINYTGGTTLSAGEGALQGLGDGKAYLDNLQVGDTIDLLFQITSTNNPEIAPTIEQMVTGNGLVLYNGELTSRNYNEDYNNKNYPRTMLATNATRDKFYMLVAEKPGMYTWQMASILKNCGAWYASGLDGGGSAQMCLHGNVLNPTTESNPRAVANSMWVISTAPEDSIITRMETNKPAVTLPIWGSYKPSFYCYNQYDALIKRNFQGTTLTCDPNVGYIDADGAFVCQGSGTLHCTYMNASYDIQINAVTDATFYFRLDSILINDEVNYQVEVLADADGQVISIHPVLLEWTVLDTDHAVVSVTNDGIISGLQNGHTAVVGKLAELTDTLFVTVEIPEHKPLLWNDLNHVADTWTIKPAASAWSPTITTNDEGKAELTFNYTATRKPNIAFTVNERLYSLPEQVEIRFNTPDVVFDYANVILRANNETADRTKRVDNLNTGDNSLLIDLHQLFDCQDIATYPVYLQSFTLYFGTMDVGQKTITFDGIYLHYKTVTILANPTIATLKVYPNPTEDYIIVEGVATKTLTLYDLQGRVMQTITNANQLNISHLPSGTYILNAGNASVQIIKH